MDVFEVENNWYSEQLTKLAETKFYEVALAQTHASAEWLKISTPEVKSCVKSREAEMKSAENISFEPEILPGDLS